MDAIKSGNVGDTQQSEIIRLVVANMFQHEKTEQTHIIGVAVLLVQKYPSCKGQFGADSVSLST